MCLELNGRFSGKSGVNDYSRVLYNRRTSRLRVWAYRITVLQVWAPPFYGFTSEPRYYMVGVPVSFKYERTVLTCYKYEHTNIWGFYIIGVRVSFNRAPSMSPPFLWLQVWADVSYGRRSGKVSGWPYRANMLQVWALQHLRLQVWAQNVTDVSVI